MRIVVFHQGALGDFLVAMGALEGVFTSGSGIVVDFWSKREHFSLLSGKKYFGDFHSLDGPVIPSLLDDSAWETASLPDFLPAADHVFIVGQLGSRLLAERLSARLGYPMSDSCRACSQRPNGASPHPLKVNWLRSFPPPDHAGSHAFEYISAQLSALGLPCAKGCLSVAPPEPEISAARQWLKERGIMARPVLVHPGSGGRKKIWPLGNWRDLLHWISGELSLPVLLSVGPADECLREFAGKMKGEGITVIQGVSQARLAAVISRCGLFIGSDSGVSHLAAAVGIPSLVIFGPTDPEVWAPRGERVRVLRGNWSEWEVLEWNPSGPPGLPDVDVTREIRQFLEARAGDSPSELALF